MIKESIYTFGSEELVTETSIIIVNYNSKHRVERAIKSILQKISNTNIEIIVVDNQSTDLSFKSLLESCKGDMYSEFTHVRIKLILNISNEGYGRACNLGADYALGDYLFFLNPDAIIEFLELDQLLIYMKKQKLEVISLKVNKCDKLGNYIKPEFTRGYFSLRSIGMSEINILKKTPKVIPSLYATGGALIIKKSLFTKIGKFNKLIFLYSEDVDLSLKCWRLGKSVFAHTKYSILHETASFNKTIPLITLYEQELNSLYILRLHLNRYDLFFAILLNLIHKCQRIIKAIFLRNFYKGQIIINSIVYGFKKKKPDIYSQLEFSGSIIFSFWRFRFKI